MKALGDTERAWLARPATTKTIMAVTLEEPGAARPGSFDPRLLVVGVLSKRARQELNKEARRGTSACCHSYNSG